MTDKPLLQPHDLRGRTLANRFALAPMTRARASEGRVPNEVMAEYYAQRSGAGLVIAEATTVSEQGNGWVASPGIYTDEQQEGWKQVAEAVHAQGGVFFLQLWHCGRASHSSFTDGALPVAASAIPIQGEGVHTPNGKQPHETPRPLRVDEIPGLVQTYVDAARRAIEAGCDGIEIHSANGYLLDTFLQSKTNHRDDQYGGSMENRFRLLREVTEAVVAEVGADRVGVRLSPNGVFNDMGSPDFRETVLYAAGQLSAIGIAYLHVMDGLAFGFHELGEAVTLAEVREVFEHTLIGNCGYDFESAEAAITAGHADLIAIGRPFISNPDLVDRYENDWPLADDADVADWYTPKGAAGYTDFPAYSG